MVLVPCPCCRRHVDKSITTCPFCEQTVSLAEVPTVPGTTQRLGRAALFAFATTAAASCGSSVETGGDTGGMVAMYGMPVAGHAGGANDSDGGNGGHPNGGSDGGGFIAAYGLPQGGDGGGPLPMYGGPHPGVGGSADGGADGGGNMTLYGLPPQN